MYGPAVMHKTRLDIGQAVLRWVKKKISNKSRVAAVFIDKEIRQFILHNDATRDDLTVQSICLDNQDTYKVSQSVP